MKDFAELIKAIAGLAWPLLVVALYIGFRDQINVAVTELTSRIRSGSKLKIGFLEIDTAAYFGEAARPRQVGAVHIRVDELLNRQVVLKQERAKYVFHVHEVNPRKSRKDEYEVLLYVVGHFNKLEHVSSVEYFLGPGWDNAVFQCDDRDLYFAVKVTAVGSFLSVARIHFIDGTSLEAQRFVDLQPVEV